MEGDGGMNPDALEELPFADADPWFTALLP